ncbi:hypothetical protein FRB94_012710 [Tulasnella sp. JGI-2019a]|nr:hypothetical protein FRB93_010528 [Tulasnella sp. JGI-2019a]KAG8991153.1 hypothetical protein FRB94_012710 [Tulasnella sp. JGI-2019a]KAG9023576.1 hypothetical protein FRB95_012893 [Tulasnella sp. JGI-2019a]
MAKGYEKHNYVNAFWGFVHRFLVRYFGNPIASETAIFELPFGLIIKWSTGTREEELHSMRYARSLGLPVPRGICYGSHRNKPGSILMTKVEGRILSDVWKQLNPSEQETIRSQMRSYLEIMRSARNPWGSRICSVTGSAIRSVRAPGGLIGPCKDEEKFHQGLIFHAFQHPMMDDAAYSRLIDTAKQIRTIPHDIVFTHGDLWHHNILVHNGRVSAILDWESAGWYPEYWEITTVLRFRPEGWWWPEFVRSISPHPYEEEQESDGALIELTGSSFEFL